jgi:hypothetical protein
MMTVPEEMFNAIRNARHFMLALMDPKQTPKVPREVRKRARERLKHFPSEFDISEMEKFHALRDEDPNILFGQCMKRLDSVRAEITIAERKLSDVGNDIVTAIRNTRGGNDAQQQG